MHLLLLLIYLTVPLGVCFSSVCVCVCEGQRCVPARSAPCCSSSLLPWNQSCLSHGVDGDEPRARAGA